MNKNSIFNTHFKASTLIVFFMLAPLTSCKDEPQVPTQVETEEAVMKKIQAANSGWASENPLGFYQNAAEDIVWIDDIGSSKRIIGREALKLYLEGFKGAVPPHRHELYNINFQHLGDIVIAYYYYQGTFEGEKAPPWKAVSIYKYFDGEWNSVHENWSLVVEEKPPQKEESVEDKSTVEAID